MEDARRYREGLACRNPGDDRGVRGWRFCERCVLLAALAGAFLIYLLLSINLEILTLPTFSDQVLIRANAKMIGGNADPTASLPPPAAGRATEKRTAPERKARPPKPRPDA